jgi:ribosomal protein L40E
VSANIGIPGGDCRKCQRSDWRPFGLAQPILAVACRSCGAIEWIGFLPAEWAEYVTPLTETGSSA